MSKSKLKPEDIFFGLQKTIAPENADAEVPAIKAEEKPAEAKPAAVEKVGEEQPLKKTKAAPRKKRGPVAKPDNARRVAVNVQVSPETKYTMQALINEMKLQGIVERYSMTDFVAEAIEEKIKREKKRFNMD